MFHGSGHDVCRVDQCRNGPGRLLLSRTQCRLNEDERRLFAAFGTLSASGFRALMKIATWCRAETRQILVREGAPVEKIYYVLDGTPMGTKAGRGFALHALPFIGEIGFLRQLPATTTGAVEPGVFYVEWPAKALSTLRMRRPVLKVALDSLLASDMAAKMAEA